MRFRTHAKFDSTPAAEHRWSDAPAGVFFTEATAMAKANRRKADGGGCAEPASLHAGAVLIAMGDVSRFRPPRGYSDVRENGRGRSGVSPAPLPASVKSREATAPTAA